MNRFGPDAIGLHERRLQRQRRRLLPPSAPAGGAPFAEWLGREAAGLGLAGLNAYSLRVGGAQHLKAHLDPGLSHDALRWAGVWADDAMASYYGGRSIEAFRSHARLMVQPTAVLPQF